jgi:hypothetical protein
MERTRAEGSDKPRTAQDWLFMVLGAFIALAVGIGLAVPLIDEVPELLRLYQTPAHFEGTVGSSVWGVARLRPAETPTALGPFCEVVHEHFVSGKGGGWRIDDDWIFRTSPGVEFPDGHVLPVSVQNASMPGTPYHIATASEEAEVRKRAPRIAMGGRLRVRCARPDASVFVDGCITLEDPTGSSSAPPVPTLGPCPAAPRLGFFHRVVAPKPLAVTAALPGADARAFRLRDVVAMIPGRLGLLAVVVAFPFFLWLRGRGGWGMIEVLRAHHRRPEKSRALPVGIALAGLLVATLILGNATFEITWMSAVGALVPPVLFALIAAWMSRMAVDVDALLTPTEALSTTPLAAAEGEEVELAVRVASDAPVHPSLLGERQYAFSRVTVWETRPQGKSSVTNIVFARSKPETIPLVDRSGRGELYTQDCAFNLLCEERSDIPPALAKVVHPTPSFSYRVREESLLPGEALYLLGSVSRETDIGERQLGTTEGSWGYRSVASHAALRGSPRKPLLAIAGTEEALVGALRPAVVRFRVGRVLFAGLACISAASAFLFAIGR